MTRFLEISQPEPLTKWRCKESRSFEMLRGGLIRGGANICLEAEIALINDSNTLFKASYI